MARKKNRKSGRRPRSSATQNAASERAWKPTLRHRGVWAVPVALAAVFALVLWRSLAPSTPSEDPARTTDARAVAPASERQVPAPSSTAALDPDLGQAIQAAVARAREEPGELGALGRLYHAHELYDLATACYQQAAERDPRDAEWPYYLGVLAQRRGEHEVAADHLRTVLELDEDDLATRVRLGEVLLSASHLDESEAVFQGLDERYPSTPWGSRGLGFVAEQRGDLETAITALERAIALDPNDGRSNYLMAMVAQRLGRQQLAGEALARFHENPEASAPHDQRLNEVRTALVGVQQRMRLAAGQVESGQLKSAKKTYEEVLERDASNFGALVNLANVHGRLGAPDEAEALLRRAIRIEPANPHGHFGLALAYASRSDFAGARDELRMVLRLDPGHEGANRLLERLPPE